MSVCVEAEGGRRKEEAEYTWNIEFKIRIPYKDMGKNYKYQCYF